MGDNRGQTIFLSVIGIATLLVAIIGATFAYFTTTINKDSVAGGNTSGTTATVGNTVFTFNAIEDSYTKLEYPGGLAVFGATATVKNEDATDTYEATYNLQIKYTNPTGTDLTWDLYELDNTVTGLDSANCTLLHKEESDGVHLWYGSDGDGNTNTDAVCRYADEETKFPAANKVSSGTLKANQAVETTITSASSDDEITEATKSKLDGKTVDTKTNSSKHYYLVVKYPNEQSNQAEPESGDAGKTISVKLVVDSGSIKVDTKAGV